MCKTARLAIIALDGKITGSAKVFNYAKTRAQESESLKSIFNSFLLLLTQNLALASGRFHRVSVLQLVCLAMLPLTRFDS